MTTRMIIDTSNLLFRVNAMNSKMFFKDDEERAGSAMHVAFQSMFKYFKRFRPDQIVFTFEGRHNWRKEFTSKNAVSLKKYKANRVKDKSMEPFFELINNFRDVMEKYSSAVTVSYDLGEADDCIAAICQMYANDTDHIIVVSGDKDFIQLLKYPGVRLIDPSSGKDRVHDDIPYFLFEKCVRGDSGDNVGSAYPRVRSTKIRKAFEDDFYRLQFMNETWSMINPETDEEITFRVGDLFEENKILMDLEHQPDNIRIGVMEAVKKAMENHGEYNNFFMLKFLGKYQLKKIAESIHLYTDMFTCSLDNKKKILNEESDGLLRF